MKVHEISSGIPMPISNEEQVVLRSIGKEGKVVGSFSDERDEEVARKMFSRGLLNKIRDKDGQFIYKISSINDIWKDR